jgi:hypothetical protein
MKRHKDLEFEVESARGGETRHGFKTFAEALGFAAAQSVSRGEAMHIDVLTWSRGAARAWGGDYGAEVYDEDPEASVHERIVVKVDSLGRIA